MKYSFSKDFETVRYTECLAEIGQLIEQLRKESGCSMKPLMASEGLGRGSGDRSLNHQ